MLYYGMERIAGKVKDRVRIGQGGDPIGTLKEDNLSTDILG